MTSPTVTSAQRPVVVTSVPPAVALTLSDQPRWADVALGLVARPAVAEHCPRSHLHETGTPALAAPAPESARGTRENSAVHGTTPTSLENEFWAHTSPRMDTVMTVSLGFLPSPHQRPASRL